MSTDITIGIVGLGYVGLPLAVAFSKHYPVVGFDINQSRVSELLSGHDSTNEVEDNTLASALSTGMTLTADESELEKTKVLIVTVPTPVDKHNSPDFTPLIKASELAGRVIKKGNYVIYESTVYPGATEEVCIPIVEKISGMSLNTDFYVGFSPERINPGDKKNTLSTIVKVTSGSNEEAADFIDNLYQSIISAGTHKAASIKVAEAAKVIENTQRDINIAFMNEIAKIFDHIGINTQQVLAAAKTKWNFLDFKPGLVGGHCIGVDPYYLVHKAQEMGYSPNFLLASRLVNESIGSFVADKVIKLMCQKGVEVVNAKVLVLGFSFKENCPDLRNTKVIEIVNKLVEYNCNVDIVDPCVDAEEAHQEYGVEISAKISSSNYSAIVVAVSHDEFIKLSVSELRGLLRPNGVIYDVKGLYNNSDIDGQL